jgi:phosphatidate cytidylyltransferase
MITAFFLLTGLILLVFFASNQLWMAACLALGLLGLREWSGFIQLTDAGKNLYSVIFLLTGITILMLPYTSHAEYHGLIRVSLLGAASFFWIIIAPIWLIRNAAFKSSAILMLLGWVLLMSTCLALHGLRDISPWLLLGIILTVSIADSAAYFAGKRFGRHKLAPAVSPGKTWEGVWGAMLAVAVYGGVLCYTQGYSYWLIISLWMLVVLSVIGDLTESLMKRKAGIKDSGNLLPGHGGILDRIDGLLPTLSVTLFCFYLALFGGFGLTH